MKTAYITAYPYATQNGKLKIPDEIKTLSQTEKYIQEHWNDIDFNEVDLDYAGTEFDFECE